VFRDACDNVSGLVTHLHESNKKRLQNSLKIHLDCYTVIGIVFVNKAIIEKQPGVWLWPTPV
jgi:hypothetical protein